MSIRINTISTLVTIQDGGRFGYQPQGVPVSGAMDMHVLESANMLVGNARYGACLEIASGKLELQVNQDCLMALTGAGSEVNCGKLSLAFNKRLLIKSGSILTFKPTSQGSWTYLSVAGGLSIPLILGSSSTYLPAGFGGLEGRALKAGDVISFNAKEAQIEDNQINTISRWGLALQRSIASIRIMAGLEWARLSDESKRIFLNTDFKITPDSNRMGYRLQGQAMKTLGNEEMISSPVTKGTVQLTHEGSPIVLMADAQTIGGYPRIAQVAAVDLPRLAQKRVGEKIHFEMISYELASALLVEHENELRKTEIAIALKMKYA